MTKSVDVLTILEHAFISLRIDGRISESDQIDLTRAAVAELIDASEAFYEAQTNMDNREYMGENAESHHKLQARLHDARRDFEGALSRVRGSE